MPRETNEGVMMHCKTITADFLTIVGLLVEPITPIAKTKDSPEAYISISKPPWTVTYIKPVIYPYLCSFLSFRSMLRSNGRSHRSMWYWWSIFESYVISCDGPCGRRNRTVKLIVQQLETVSPLSISSRGGMLSFGVPVSVEKWLLKQSRASRPDNYLITINFS